MCIFVKKHVMRVEIEIPENKWMVFKAMMDELRFIESVEVMNYDVSKAKLRRDLHEALAEVKLIQEGKLPATNVKDFLDELEDYSDNEV